MFGRGYFSPIFRCRSIVVRAGEEAGEENFSFCVWLTVVAKFIDAFCCSRLPLDMTIEFTRVEEKQNGMGRFGRILSRSFFRLFFCCPPFRSPSPFFIYLIFLLIFLSPERNIFIILLSPSPRWFRSLVIICFSFPLASFHPTVHVAVRFTLKPFFCEFLSSTNF
jgi:hypothetical protein